MTDSEVKVNITAQTQDFVPPIHDAGDQFENFSSRIRAHLGAMSEAFSVGKEAAEGFIAAFAVEKIAEFLDKVGEYAEGLQRASAMTGLSTQAIQQFQFAVTLSGGDAATTTQMIDRLEKSMASVSNPTSQAALAFQAMGVSATDATGKLRPVSGVLADIANYFSKTADGPAKTAIAMDLMGRSGAQLIPVLNKGAAGLEELNQKFAETQSTLGSQDVEALSNYAENVKVLSTAWQGLKDQVALALVPLGNLVVTFFTQLDEAITKDILKIREFVAELKIALGATPPEVLTEDKPQAATPQTAKQITDAKSAAEEELKITYEEQQSKLAQFKETSSSKQALDTEDNAHLLAIGAESMQEYISNQKAILQQQETTYGTTYEAMLKDTEEFYAKKKVLADGDAAELAKINEQEQKEYEKLSLDKQKADDKFTLENKKLNDKASQDSLKDYKTFFDSITKSWESVTEQLIRGTTTWGQAFKTIVGNMIVDFAKMAEANVAKAIWADLTTKGSSITTSLVKQEANASTAAGESYVWGAEWGGPIAGAAAAAAAYAGVLAFGIPSAAGGWGEVPQDGLAMIHKKEMVLPASIADKVRNMTEGSGGGHIFNISISAVDSASVKNLFMQNGGALVASINQQVRNLNPKATM